MSRVTPRTKPTEKYSWIKAPRFDGHPKQVGPLAQVLIGFAQGHEPTVRWAKKTLDVAGKVAGATLTPAVLHSTLGRHAARMIRMAVISELAARHWSLLAENSFDPCIACAVHTLDVDGKELSRVRVL